MSRPRTHHDKGVKAAPPDLKKPLWLVFGIALSAGILAAVLMYWDPLHSTTAEEVVRIYRLHGCRCAFSWARSLEANGFIVRLSEVQTLQHVRTRLQVPAHLHGCHLGAYLGYFIEGHVDPSALRTLATERPDGLGVVTEPAVDMEKEHSLSVRDEHSPVLLVERDGRSRAWFQPSASKEKSRIGALLYRERRSLQRDGASSGG